MHRVHRARCNPHGWLPACFGGLSRSCDEEGGPEMRTHRKRIGRGCPPECVVPWCHQVHLARVNGLSTSSSKMFVHKDLPLHRRHRLVSYERTHAERCCSHLRPVHPDKSCTHYDELEVLSAIEVVVRHLHVIGRQRIDYDVAHARWRVGVWLGRLHRPRDRSNTKNRPDGSSLCSF